MSGYSSSQAGNLFFTGGIQGTFSASSPANVACRNEPGGSVTVDGPTVIVGGARIKTNTVSFPAGYAVEFHRHNCNEMIVVLTGDCAVEVEGTVPVALKPFDTVSVEAGTWHRFLSTGDTGFTLLAIYDAERVERTLRDSGQTTID